MYFDSLKDVSYSNLTSALRRTFKTVKNGFQLSADTDIIWMNHDDDLLHKSAKLQSVR